MSEGRTFTGQSSSLGGAGGLVTLVEETSFCLSGRGGDIHPGSPQGLFYLDTRLLSRLELRVGGALLEPLAVSMAAPFAATFVGRPQAREGQADSELLVLRRRYVGRGLREDLEIRNYSDKDREISVELGWAVDFADLFAVKEGRAGTGEHAEGQPAGAQVRFRRGGGGQHRQVMITAGDAEVNDSCARWAVGVPAHGSWSACVQVTVQVAGDDVEPRYRCGEAVADTTPTRRLERWRQSVPTLDADWAGLRTAYDQSLVDVGSLRLFDPKLEHRPVVAAGAPWFMTVFGRDSLLTAYESLIVSTDLALGVLAVLADLQGTKVDPESEEQPGRILHEIRYGSSSSIDLAAGHVYYGTADATPLFVVLLGECLRWGVPYEQLAGLVPHADRALAWVENYGDRDGDGFVEYERMTEHGLANQGWKDSWDGVPFADGRLAEPPIALCEVQGYVYAAYLARAALAAAGGDDATRQRCEQRAAELRRRFDEAFWLPDRGWYAIALDGDKRPVDGLASNMGHCLWSGIVEERRAGAVAERLLSPEMFSGWGIRTLASSMASYNPGSYHCGSVWPHDNAICVAGLVRYGFIAEAGRVMQGLVAAAETQGGRLPELFSGLARGDVGTPVSYPTSCSPQAWSAAAPLLLVRSMLRLDADVPAGRLWLAPALPEGVTRLILDGLPLAGGRLQVSVVDGRADVQGAPMEIGIVRSPRPS